MTFAITKSAGILRVVATGNTFESRDELKAHGFGWDGSAKAWTARRPCGDDEDATACGAWLEGLIRAFAGETWIVPDWMRESVEDIRKDQFEAGKSQDYESYEGFLTDGQLAGNGW